MEIISVFTDAFPCFFRSDSHGAVPAASRAERVSDVLHRLNLALHAGSGDLVFHKVRTTAHA